MSTSFFDYLLTIIILNNASSSMLNGISNQNIPIYVFVGAIGAIIASIISGLFLLKISKHSLKQNSRLTFFSTLLSNDEFIESLRNLMDTLEKRSSNQKTLLSKEQIIIEVNRPWCILLFLLSNNHYRSFVELINKEEWNKALDLLKKYLIGYW
ncbi:hypothetical protein F1737_05960 [Methanoplanus sp. FWC-SCC4]|uniref:Uncharacterized protein n=1 Tax=Methanochimaera problematica TaxID=2609417 RepID=A0AA97I497_9EURY|nr:hypothetical protein [Methanoplanus sp. FWC-SCC4]WOF16289.1 hypothetical protein F1737_05960 [Methanoplanus sp. FWC-SCC4]